MPSVTRSRRIEAPAARIWELIADPHNLPRWWPRVTRVEDVHGGGERVRWTAVLETERGAGVRADFRSAGRTAERRFAWTQDVEGTAFAKVLARSATEVTLEAADGATTTVRLSSEERLRGMARLGSVMVRGAARRRLDEALDGIERAVVEAPRR